MGSLEDRYNQQEARRPKVPTDVEWYNVLVDIYREITGKILANVRANPPKEYDWIEVDGRRMVGWQLYCDYDHTCILYILSDGRLMRAEDDRSRIVDHFYVKVGVKTYDVRPLSRPMTEQELYDNGRITLQLLRELCRSIVSSVPVDIGLSKLPKWSHWYKITR